MNGDYRIQSPAVADRFSKLRERPVVLDVQDLTKTFWSHGLEHTTLDRISCSGRQAAANPL